jgi:O-antigen ligase
LPLRGGRTFRRVAITLSRRASGLQFAGIAGFIAAGVLVGLVLPLSLQIARPLMVGLAIIGLILLLPVFLVRDPKAYGLFLLIFSIPIDIASHTTKNIIDPGPLFHEYGMPGSGTLGIDIYVTDVVLFALVLAWLGRLCSDQEKFYFPKIGCVAILYLVWGLFTSIIEAKSFYLSLFEWWRDLLCLLIFVYLVNNVVTLKQLRAVVLALLLGMAIESAITIAFFDYGIGTEVNLFAELVYGPNRRPEAGGTLPVTETGEGSQIKRSAGTFAHPSMTAYYIGFILPIAMGYMVAARRFGYRLCAAAVTAASTLALYLTFSRAGVLGFIGSCLLFFPLARWSRLISQYAFAWLFLLFLLAAMASTPLLVNYIESRPVATAGRLQLIDMALSTFWRHPIMGAGMNNSSAATEGSLTIIVTPKGTAFKVTVVHNHFLIVLVEVGIVGFVLFFGFFGLVGLTALRYLRRADSESNLLLVGMLSALVGIAIHNLGDPFGGHMCITMLWMHAGLIFAICRRIEAVPALAAAVATSASRRRLAPPAMPVSLSAD